MSSGDSFVYVFNDGSGKFKFKQVREASGQDRLCEHVFEPFDLNGGNSQDGFKLTRVCSGCSRSDLPVAVKCRGCAVSLCELCCRANHIPGGATAKSNQSHEVPRRVRSPEQRSQQEPDEQDFFEQFLTNPSFGQQQLQQQRRNGLFPAGQTIEFSVVASGRTKDLHEQLALFVNSRLGEKENQVEHVTIKQEFSRAWLVVKSPQVLAKFKSKTGKETRVDLLDGWRVTWKEYTPPPSRTVYQVGGVSNPSTANFFCATIRSLIEEQFKMGPADVDLVMASEGSVMVVFSHGEYDVEFARSLFLPDGKELQLIPTAVKV